MGLHPKVFMQVCRRQTWVGGDSVESSIGCSLPPAFPATRKMQRHLQPQSCRLRMSIQTFRFDKMHLHYPQSGFKIVWKSPDRRTWHKWEKSIVSPPPPPNSCRKPCTFRFSGTFLFSFQLNYSAYHTHKSSPFRVPFHCTAGNCYRRLLARQRHKLG